MTNRDLHRHHHLRASKRFIAFAAFALLFSATIIRAVAADAKIAVEISPNPFAPGQAATLSITVDNGNVTGIPQLRLPDGLSLAGGVSSSTQMSINNGVSMLSTTLEWPITADKEGSYVIPPIDMPVDGRIVKTRELKIEVSASAQAPSPNGPASGQDNGLGQFEPILQLNMARTEFYQGEIVPITATLFIPRTEQIQLQRTGLIEVEKTDLAIQRFPQQGDQSLETIGNMRYLALTYRSSLSALKPGKIKVGPAKMELALGIVVGGRRSMPFGFMQMEQRKVVVKAPEISINVLPLPKEGRPAGFSGAVGDFTLSATTTATEVSVGDPVAVDLLVEGSGNFDSLDTPKLTDTKGWKTYSAKRYNVDSSDPNTADLMNRRLGFNQIIVPEKVANEVPPFEFSFFSLRTKQYTTLRSNPIPIVIKPAANAAAPAGAGSTDTGAVAVVPPVAAPAPEVNITDILMPLKATPTWAVASAPLQRSPWFIAINALLLLALIALIGASFWQQEQLRRAQSNATERAKLLHELQAAGLSEAEFYRQAAHFVQQFGAGSSSSDLAVILTKYEALNFAGTSAGAALINEAERTAVLTSLNGIKVTRSTPPPVPAPALGLVLLLGFALTAQASPQEQYQSAAEALAKNDFGKATEHADAAVKEGAIGADVFALLGHAAYKQKQSGLAAVWYQRAQLFPASAPELRQNLRHIAEKTHFFAFEHNDAFSRFGLFFSRNTWVLLATMGAWLGLFAIVGIGLNIARWSCVAALPIGLLVCAVGMLGHAARPSYETVKDLAFVTADGAQAHTAATQISGSVIAVPAGSTVRKLDVRGSWTYVEIPQEGDSLRGWLPTNQLEDYWPYNPALLP